MSSDWVRAMWDQGKDAWGAERCSQEMLSCGDYLLNVA